MTVFRNSDYLHVQGGYNWSSLLYDLCDIRLMKAKTGFRDQGGDPNDSFPRTIFAHCLLTWRAIHINKCFRHSFARNLIYNKRQF